MELPRENWETDVRSFMRWLFIATAFNAFAIGWATTELVHHFLPWVI